MLNGKRVCFVQTGWFVRRQLRTRYFMMSMGADIKFANAAVQSFIRHTVMTVINFIASNQNADVNEPISVNGFTINEKC